MLIIGKMIFIELVCKWRVRAVWLLERRLLEFRWPWSKFELFISSNEVNEMYRANKFLATEN